MAEAAARGEPELAPLARLDPRDLDAVLEEEIREWRAELFWDFTASADLVRHYVEVQILNGFALMEEGAVVGYSYYVIDEQKGLIGDLYVRPRWRSADNEQRLLAAVVDALYRSPVVCRIESQLMMLASSRAGRLPHAEALRAYPRNFMAAPLDDAEKLAPGRAAGRVLIESWKESHQEAAARVIALAYAGHIDSRINNQYNSIAGARRFLHNIIEYPGCGTFFQPASFLALERATAEACGMSLGSLVAPDVGHITQICVLPRMQGAGVGYELLRRSLAAFRAHGCRKVSLTVTATNQTAIRLYERTGFRTVRRFDALVWDGF